MAEPCDAMMIAQIYNHYVNESVITFEEEPVTDSEMALRIAKGRSASLPWLIAETSGQLTGYAYAAPWRERSAYRFSVESTIYVAPECVGRGISASSYTVSLSRCCSLLRDSVEDGR